MTLKARLRFVGSSTVLGLALVGAARAQAATTPSHQAKAGKSRVAMATTSQNSVTAQPTPAEPIKGISAAKAPENQPANQGEIVVTATRREQALQDVPIAVTALGGNTLAAARINNTAELAEKVPNLNITQQVSAFVVYLRGVGQLATNPGQEPSVATYVDGVYQPSPFSALLSLADVQRVEVIKGPQGTLFGRNATGGLINVITKDPTQDFHGTALLSYGNFETVRASGYVTGGIANGVAADFAGYYLNQGKGVGRNLATGKRLEGTENLDLRSKLLIEPTDTTKIRISGNYTHNHSAQGNNLAILPPSVAFGTFTHTGGFYDVNSDLEPRNSQTNWQVSGRIDQEFNPFNLVSITSYSHVKAIEQEDADTTPIPLLHFFGSQKSKIFTQEVQLVSKKGSPLDWIVGAYYFNSDAEGTPGGVALRGVAFGCLTCGVNFRSHLKTDSIAGYAEATYQVLPNFDLTAGVRYTSDKKRLSSLTDVVTSGVVTATVPGFGSPPGFAPGEAKKTFNKWTYRAIAAYHFTRDIMGYVSYSRGFKSGGYDTAAANGIPYDPEVVDAYEAGLKTQFLDHQLTFNTAAFLYNYKGLQLPVLLPGTTSVQATLNAANAKVKGLDIDGSYHPSRYFNLTFGLGLLDSKYENFKNAPCTVLNPDGSVSGTPGTATQPAGFCDVSGNDLIHAPRFTANIGGTGTLPTSVGDFTLSANLSHQGRFFWDVTNRLRQDAYDLVNGTVGWTPKGGMFEVDAFVENLFNKKYYMAQYVQAAFPDRYQAGRPRMYGIELRARW